MPRNCDDHKIDHFTQELIFYGDEKIRRATGIQYPKDRCETVVLTIGKEISVTYFNVLLARIISQWNKDLGRNGRFYSRQWTVSEDPFCPSNSVIF